MSSNVFNILDHVEKLEPAKEQGRYICPVCEGGNLSINRESGAYQCWNGCECKDIRDTIAPLPSQNYAPRRQTSKGRPVQKPKPTAPPTTDVHLAKLPAPATDIPQPQRDFDREHREIFKTTYVYSLTPEGQLNRWVIRTDWKDTTKPHGRDKTFRQWHRSESGEAVCKKGDKPWEPYRIDEFLQVLKATSGCPAGLVVEGEKCVETIRTTSGLAATSLQGSSWGEDDLQRLAEHVQSECPSAVLVFLRDNDPTDCKKGKSFQEACDRVGVFSIVIDPLAIYPDLPDKGDVVEILAAMNTPEFIKRLEEEIHRSIEPPRDLEQKLDNTPNTFDPANEFVQKARRQLYGEKSWICVNGTLHYWTGSYYKPSLDVVESQRLWRYCNSYPVQDQEGNVSYPFASPSWVKKALEWVKMAYGIDPTSINPPGLNCGNGVLQLTWKGDKPSWELKDHNPELYYTYEPVTTYNPSADSTDCDRALEVLDAPQREIFLRSVAASLDLATVRQHKGRLVRALLLKGCGSNGKDTLREIVATMYGYQGMTGATLTDFASYDQGRKFPLARLNRSRVNWASENASTTKLDKIQSLKAFITGDPLSIEGKGRDEYEFTPVGVAFFNVNDTPNLQASLEAIQSRWGVLSFNKTFKIGADITKGELEADPRFKYDPDFLRSNVLPAFLNRVLAALVDLMASGIDYSCTQQALENIQAENSHLFQFCLDVGLSYDPNGTISAGEIWERLEDWYIDNGTLTYEEDSKGKKKSLWVDQARRDDANVKGPNQVLARFQSLFPKAKRTTVGKGKMALQGISFRQQQPEGEPVEPVGEAMVSQLVRQKPLPSKDGEPVTPVSQLAEEFESESPNLEQNRSGEEQSRSGENKKDNRCQNLPRLAHHPDTVRNTGSPTAPLTGSPLPKTGSPLPQPQTSTIAPHSLQLADVQAELNLSVVEKNNSISEEFIEVLLNGEWVKALLLQEPNNHTDASLRITGWKVQLLATGFERYFWSASEIRKGAT